MNRDAPDNQVDALRAAFDQGFAAAPAPPPQPSERLLAIQVAGVPYAVMLGEVASLLVDRAITPLPSAAATCLGVTAISGTMIPVHSLAALLGHDAGARPPRWMFCIAGAQVALAFDGFEGQLHVPQDAIAPVQPGMAHPYLAASAAGRAIVRLPAITEDLEARSERARQARED